MPTVTQPEMPLWFKVQGLDTLDQGAEYVSRLQTDLRVLLTENEQLRRKVKGLEADVAAIGEIAYAAPEVNPANYNHDDVMELNAAMIEVYKIAVKEQPCQT